ncbi:hypothetical protein ACFQ51_28195 [Streptomyces kaempferi]
MPIVAVLGTGSAAGAEPLASIPCKVTALNNAIVAANNNTGPHTIRLAPKCVYNVTTPASTGGLGANALPRITGTVTLLGHNTTIRRDPDVSDGVRIAEIDGPNGRLTVDGVTATGGGYLDYAEHLPAHRRSDPHPPAQHGDQQHGEQRRRRLRQPGQHPRSP